MLWQLWQKGLSELIEISLSRFGAGVWPTCMEFEAQSPFGLQTATERTSETFQAFRLVSREYLILPMMEPILQSFPRVGR